MSMFNSVTVELIKFKCKLQYHAIACVGMAMMLSLSGCNYEGEGEGENEINNSPVNASVSPDVVINEIGRQLYGQMCVSCHGANGTGTGLGPSLVGCSTCGSENTLANRIESTMPLNSVGSCDADCARNIAQYVLVLFNGQTSATTTALKGINALDPKTTLRKASLNLVGRLPTTAELEQIASNGEAGLSAALDQMMTEDAFFHRLKEIYNDRFLTNKYLGSEKALNLLDGNDFPNRRWFNDIGLNTDNQEERDLYYRLKAFSNDAVAQEALELITYVVRNNRPFTEILTADYMVVNPYSARVYGVEQQLTFDTNDHGYGAVSEFKPARILDYPHAGVLTSAMFLNRFPTTETNRNRKRTKVTFDYFLDTDILAIGSTRPTDADDIAGNNPTLTNPTCVACHEVMDPVASTFQNWDYKGRYRIQDKWFADMESRGFNGQQMPIINTDNSLQWLAAQMATDPRFAKATVKTIYTGLSGHEPLLSQAVNAKNDANVTADYVAQRALLDHLEKQFIADQYNLKNLVRNIIMSHYWRAESLTDGVTDTSNVIGSARLLIPEMLDRKLKAIFGFEWKRRSYDRESRLAGINNNGYRQIYGGIDSDLVTNRITQVNGMILAVQNRMASELSCKAVANDFYLAREARLLFPHVSKTTSPEDLDGVANSASENMIRQNIQHLHWVMLGETLAINDQEIDATYQLFIQIFHSGQQLLEHEYNKNRYLPSSCRLYYHPETGERLSSEVEIVVDDLYTMRAWMGVLAYLISDYRFVYE